MTNADAKPPVPGVCFLVMGVLSAFAQTAPVTAARPSGANSEQK